MFDKESIDFGTVSAGTTRQIQLRYTGEEPFDITQMSTSCSCTSPSYNKDTNIITFSTTFKGKGSFSTTARYKDTYIIIKATVV